MRKQIQATFCFFYLFGIAAVSCQIYAGTILANASTQSANYTLKNQTIAVSVLLKIKEQYSNLVLLADTDPIPNLNITPQSLSNYYLQNHTILQQMDISRAIAGIGQLVNLKMPTGTSTLYLMLYNLDFPDKLINKNFTFQILEYSKKGDFFCYDCPFTTSNDRANGNCQCKPCPQNTYGPACQYYQKSIAPKILYNVSFYKLGNLYLRIVNPSQKIILSFTQLTNTNSSTLYIQYQAESLGIAGYLNTYYDTNKQPYAYAITNTTKTITIKTNSKNISLTIACRLPLNTLINFSYSPPLQNSQATLGLILGLGIGIPIAIIIVLFVAIILFCRQRTAYGPQNALVNAYLLTFQEIERYLPQVPSALILKSLRLDQSKQNIIKQSDNVRKDQQVQQCCICLIQITQNQKIRVAFCKHFFHSSCLIGWFAKNQICPYCRRECSYPHTLASYQKLKGNGHDLVGQMLVQAIFKQKKYEQNAANNINNEQQNINIDQLSHQINAEQSSERQNQGNPDAQENQRNSGVQQHEAEQRRSQPVNIPNLQVITPSLDEFQIE